MRNSGSRRTRRTTKRAAAPRARGQTDGFFVAHRVGRKGGVCVCVAGVVVGQCCAMRIVQVLASCATLLHSNDTWLIPVKEAHSKDARTLALGFRV